MELETLEHEHVSCRDMDWYVQKLWEASLDHDGIDGVMRWYRPDLRRKYERIHYMRSNCSVCNQKFRRVHEVDDESR